MANIFSKLDPGEGKGSPIEYEDFKRGAENGDKLGGSEKELKYAEEHEKPTKVIDEGTDDRAGTTIDLQKWPRAKEDSLYVEIPYTISCSFDPEERAAIASGIEQFHAKTCIR